MLLPISQRPPSSSKELGETFTKRRHGQDDGTSGGPESDEALGSNAPVITSATGLTSPTTSLQPEATSETSLQPEATSETSFPGPTATGNSNATVFTLQFMNVHNATTCESYTVSWSYGSPSRTTFALFVTENLWGPNNNATMPHYNGGSPPLLRMLSPNIFRNATNFTWSSVDLQEGWYMLDARLPRSSGNMKFLPQSAPLYVSNGTNTSCVKPSTPLTDSHSRLGTGDVVAIIIGAVAAAGLLAVAFAFPRLWRRDLPSPKKRRPYYLY